MKTVTTIIILCLSLISTMVFSQERVNTDQGFESIRKDLSNWDAIRGPWLASSMQAIANNEPVPMRTFPENFTPNQMMRMVDNSVRQNIRTTVKENRSNASNPALWNSVNRLVESTFCTPQQGRSYGDPHMVSFDGARYSFQTVGEFVLSKTNNSDVEIQTRQKPQSDDFSLNTAVAMNVGGDRLAIYAEDYPDANYSTPVRLNGQPLQLNASTFFLEHGGTVQKTGNSYFVHWPNGESAKIELRNSGKMSFLNVTMSILPCVTSGYSGVLGNANGQERDDFDPGINVPIGRQVDPFDDNNYYDRVRQAEVARMIADNNRVTDFTTLFDYAIGKNTMSFTDRSFPRVYRTINDLDRRNRDVARRRCEQGGIASRDMNACIYDNAFLNIEPTREPIMNDPVANTRELRKIEREVINRNPTPDPIPTRGSSVEIKETVRNTDKLDNTSPVPRTSDRNTNFETIKNPDPVKQPTPVRETRVIKNPVRTPVRTSTPPTRTTVVKPPVRQPIRRPVTKPVPTPKPTPRSPAPTPSIRKGKGF